MTFQNSDITNVIAVTLLPEGQLAQRDNMNICAVFTSQDDGAVCTAQRTASYRNSASVAADFGSTSEVMKFANAFFAQEPNAVSAGGEFVVAFWRAAQESVDATSGTLRGAQLSEAATLGALQAITNGSFVVTVDTTARTVDNLDFRLYTSLQDVVTAIDTELATFADATLEDGRIVIKSLSTGAASTITFATVAGSGTFVGTALGLATGTGATITQGAAATTLSAETKVEALTAAKTMTNFKGFCFIDALTDAEVALVASWAQANSTLAYEVFTANTNLAVNTTNPVWLVKLSSQTNFRCLFSKLNNRAMAAAYMSRAHTVNFNAENSALTMQLKTLLEVVGEGYSQTEINNAKRVGLDIYTRFKDVGAVLTSGANDYVDNRYNLLGYIDAVQTDAFNLLKATALKIPQTTRGVQQIVDAVEKTTRGFVRAGVFAAGEWSSPDTFGDLDTFKEAIRTNGFYVLAGSLIDQPQSDRQARKSPVIQVAVKNAGAIHSVDIIIKFNL